MLTVKDMSITYQDHTVLDKLNLTLDHDEILMLVGPTGCGKTSTLKALAGLVPISNGNIQLGNWTATPKNKVAPEKRNLGMVFQDFALFPHLTVAENIGFRLKQQEPVEHWMKLLGLSQLRQQKPSTLSGGQKQRVALARTLAHQPSLVLLDEPLSNLDAALKDDLRWDIRNALKSAGIPAIWVTHDQEEALSVGDRIGVLHQGKLEQLDSPQQCYEQPANAFVAQFLGEASFVPAKLLSPTTAATEFGIVEICTTTTEKANVEVLIRPEEMSLTASEQGQCTVLWSRYEGAMRTYLVETSTGQKLKIRTSRQQYIEQGQQVEVNIQTSHPLVAFAEK